jgi:hypothetical protein
MIEAEIADLINAKFTVSSHSEGWAGESCAACGEASHLQQLVGANNEADGTGVDLNGAYLEQPKRNSDIKVYDPERLVDTALSAAAQLRRRITIGGAIALTLGIGWSGRWYSSQSTRAAPSSIPSEHKIASAGSDQPISTVRPAAAFDAPQQAMPGLSTNQKTNNLQHEVGFERMTVAPPLALLACRAECPRSGRSEE